VFEGSNSLSITEEGFKKEYGIGKAPGVDLANKYKNAIYHQKPKKPD